MKPYNQYLSSFAQLSEQLILLTASITAKIKGKHQLYKGLHFGSDSSTGQVRGPGAREQEGESKRRRMNSLRKRRFSMMILSI